MSRLDYNRHVNSANYSFADGHVERESNMPAANEVNNVPWLFGYDRDRWMPY